MMIDKYYHLYGRKDDVIFEEIPKPERKKGKWINEYPNYSFWARHTVKCSICGNILDLNGVNAGRGDANFCPECGADMRSEQDE